MATDYIRRAGMMRHIEREAKKWGEDYDAMQILGDIEDFPAADVRRVVRGMWKQLNESEKYKCSNCGRMLWFSKRLSVSPDEYKFCPNCGADMRG